MSAMCYTVYEFHGKADELQQLYDMVDMSISDVTTRQKPFADWVGNILCNVGSIRGLDDADLKNANVIELFGVEEHKDEYMMVIEVETEYYPLEDVWDEILDVMNLESVRYCLRAENAYGGEENVKYDPHKLFTGKGDYWISYSYSGTSNMSYGDNDAGRFYTKKQAIALLQAFTGSKEKDFNKLCEIADDACFTDDKPNDFIMVTKYRDITNE